MKRRLESSARIASAAFAACAMLALLIGMGSELRAAEGPKGAAHKSAAASGAPRKRAAPHGSSAGGARGVDAGSRDAQTPPRASDPGLERVQTDAGLVETKTLDGGTQVFRFGEVDIEGRLSNPELVYFLKRVRAEFAAGVLGHRTFLREMSETRKEAAF